MVDDAPIEKDIEVIEWDYLEHRYIDNIGNLYRTIDDIPENIRHLVKPIEPIKPFKLRRRSCQINLCEYNKT